MSAVLVEKETEATLISHYATDAEGAAVRNAHSKIAAAEQNAQRIRSVLFNVHQQLADVQNRGRKNIARAAAVALGEAPPDEPAYDGPTASELDAQAKGLEHRAKEAEEAVQDAKGKFRAAVHDLIRACAERCAADYLEATRRQAWAHQQLAVAQKLVGQVRPLVDLQLWDRYAVPASHHIPLLRKEARDEFSQLTLMSADRLSLTEKNALADLRKQAVDLFGEWPL
jgi:hypothetical protein